GARAATTLSAPVGIKRFAATGPNPQLGLGLATLLISDMTNTSSGDCEPLVIEVMRRQEILDELALANSRLVDPGARIPSAHLCGSQDHLMIETNSMAAVAPYAGTGLTFADVPVRAVGGTTPPTSWAGQTDVVFSALQYGGVPECTVAPGPHSGYAKVEIKRAAAPDLIEVTWGGETFTFTELACPGSMFEHAVAP